LAQHCPIAPVFELGSDPELFRHLIKQAVWREGIGLSFRCPIDHISGTDGASRLERKLQAFGMGPERVRLIVDQGIVDDNVSPIDTLLNLPHLSRWLDTIAERPAVKRGVDVPDRVDLEEMIRKADEARAKVSGMLV